MESNTCRVSHPNALSQARLRASNHAATHATLEASHPGTITLRSRFHLLELRPDSIRHFGVSDRHALVRNAAGELRIKLQRVDMFNSQAPFDYVLQIWV